MMSTHQSPANLSAIANSEKVCVFKLRVLRLLLCYLYNWIMRDDYL